MKPSEAIKRDLGLIIEFRDAYIALLDSSRRVDNWPRDEYVPAVDKDTWAALDQKVAVAAGAAQYAYERQGGGTFTTPTDRFNPIANWSRSIQDAEAFKPRDLLTGVEGAIGSAAADCAAAADRERGLVGFIASFIRWPQTLREAVGPGWAPKTAAGAIGFIGQVMVAALGAALATGIVALCVWLWSDVVSPALGPQPNETLSPSP